mgnify:CR=1 FL=1
MRIFSLRKEQAVEIFPIFGDTHLTQFAAVALDQIHRDMQLPASATASGLAALAGADRQSPAQHGVGMNQLCRSRSRAALGSGQAGAMQGAPLF